MSATTAAAIWHDVECGSYEADLPLWEELAERCGGPVLELGCGTGRVALHLARRGHRVIGLDRDPELLAALSNAHPFSTQRSGSESDAPADLVEPLLADARGFELESPAALVLAPTHLLQLLAGSAERAECLRCVAARSAPGRPARRRDHRGDAGARRRPAAPPRRARGRRLGLLEPCGRGGDRARARSSSAGCARRSLPRGS